MLCTVTILPFLETDQMVRCVLLSFKKKKTIKFITKEFILLLYDIHHAKFMRWRGITRNENKETN